MKTNDLSEEAISTLTEEQQKEYNYIDGKLKRRGPTFPHEYDTWRKLRENDKEFRKQTDCLFAGISWKIII